MKTWKLALAVGLLGLGSVAQAGLMSYTANGLDLVYDDDRDLTWVADANLFKTQYDADNALVDQIIADVGSITDGLGVHVLVPGDFNTTSGRMTWWGAMGWAQWLGMTGYGGASDWRLPVTPQPDATCTNQFDPGGGFPLQGFGSNCTGSDLGHLFYEEGMLSAGHSILANPPGILDDYFTNLQSLFYWSGTEYAPNPNNAWNFNTDNGNQNNDNKDNQNYGWADRPG